MKKEKIIYWSSTAIVAFVMLWSACNFAFNPGMKDAFAHFGLPNWFRIELTVAKFFGTLALIIPGIPHKIKEFAYAGFLITLLSAPVAHLTSGDSVLLEIGHTFFLVMLIVSYTWYRKLRKAVQDKKMANLYGNTSVLP